MKAVVAKIVSVFDYEYDNTDYISTTYALMFQRGKYLYHGSRVDSDKVKIKTFDEIRDIVGAEVVEVLPNYPAAYKVNHLTADEIFERSAFEERARLYILQKYQIPHLTDFNCERDWGWISRDGIFYSNGYAQHSATCLSLVNGFGWNNPSEFAESIVFDKGFIRVTPFGFSFNKRAFNRASEAQVYVMDKLSARWAGKYGLGDALLASYLVLTGREYAAQAN